MKKLSLIILCLLCTPAFADDAQAELLSAQVAYQKALKNYDTQYTSLTSLQERLNIAKQKLIEAQNSVNKLEQDLSSTQQAQTQANSTLQAAGQRLDAAWMNVKGR